MSKADTWRVQRLEADVRRLMVRLQQAEGHIAMLIAFSDTGYDPTETGSPERSVGMSPALGAPYDINKAMENPFPKGIFDLDSEE
jgi:hypothetical protein